MVMRRMFYWERFALSSAFQYFKPLQCFEAFWGLINSINGHKYILTVSTYKRVSVYAVCEE